MKPKRTMKNLLATIASVFILYTCSSQSVVSSAITPAGTSYKSETFTLNYIVGEPLNTFIEKGDLCIAQGVLQIIVRDITNVNTPINTQNIKVHPNPTVDNLFIDFSGDARLLSYQLFNTTGVLMSSANFKNETSNIDVSNLPAGNYVLSILEETKLYKTFKIIKQ